MLDLSIRQRGAFGPRGLFASGAAGLWYDPSDIASMSQDDAGAVPAAVDAPVGRILDRSGRGNHGVQASAAARPMLRRDGGGRLYLDFDGVDDRLATVGAMTVAQPFSFAVAARRLALSGSDKNLFRSGSSAVAYLNSASGLFRWDMFAGSILSSGQTPPQDAAFTGLGVFNGAASVVSLNGAESAGNAGTGGLASGAGLMIGSGGTGNYWHGRIYGLLIVARALDAGERRRLRRYMAARAGIAV